jgi:hypothetical protein
MAKFFFFKLKEKLLSPKIKVIRYLELINFIPNGYLGLSAKLEIIGQKSPKK